MFVTMIVFYVCVLPVCMTPWINIYFNLWKSYLWQTIDLSCGFIFTNCVSTDVVHFICFNLFLMVPLTFCWIQVILHLHVY